ncbi:septal ring lytic transglycosylase RlpA family protein [Aureimonas phyllosphaerae]|uniref:Endolytic peptidoglycan transglycosylase RlpA n=1 Tax=Aureimonas phyllosphaerae TaxID=1166078 RepID=A0A7W6BRJ9_9HYPH|nr:rare lipoprotein A [Aureimonas phyllosphaerae]MBB3960366.1 rare lipoprotein A [Aureimonas phyllosphaerae]SFF22087.1 rare lipoprotein A [Aureimonas phyllosphaerae]
MIAKSLTAVALVGAALLTSVPAEAAGGKTTCGGASWYALTSRTASGERMNPMAMTAAHKTLPLGSKVKVTNLRNQRSVVVRINDRGPFIKGRLIDLSKGAAQRLGFIDSGHTRVQIEPADGSGTDSCA